MQNSKEKLDEILSQYETEKNKQVKSLKGPSDSSFEENYYLTDYILNDDLISLQRYYSLTNLRDDLKEEMRVREEILDFLTNARFLNAELTAKNGECKINDTSFKETVYYLNDEKVMTVYESDEKYYHVFNFTFMVKINFLLLIA